MSQFHVTASVNHPSDQIRMPLIQVLCIYITHLWVREDLLVFKWLHLVRINTRLRADICRLSSLLCRAPTMKVESTENKILGWGWGTTYGGGPTHICVCHCNLSLWNPNCCSWRVTSALWQWHMSHMSVFFLLCSCIDSEDSEIMKAIYLNMQKIDQELSNN